jgi:hypothetical protein
MQKTYEVMAVSDGEPLLLEAIEHQGDFWLVPQWIEDKALKQRRPARAIRLDGLKPFARQPWDDCDFYVPQTMSKALLFGDPSPEEQQQYLILDGTALASAIPGAFQ